VYDDVEAIRRELGTVKAVSPRVYTHIQIVYGNQNWRSRISGVEPVYFHIKDWPMMLGTVFTDEDVELANNVVVIGTEVRDILFGEEESIGKTVRIKNLPFRVVGVAEHKGPSAEGYPQDDAVYMPWTTAQKKVTGYTWLNSIQVQAVSAEATALAQKQIEELLRERHRIPPEAEDDFSVRNTADIAELHEEAGRVMTMLLGAIASVSLLVGGIGIMNIMLVSVTERTREIGVRMAIGATESDVQAQFLVEAVVLSIFGGALGIAFGLGASKVLTNLLEWPSRVSPASIAAAVVVSAGIGVFFGLFPARRASRLDPIEALRYE
jgi:putative ABC transport system permease protein